MANKTPRMAWLNRSARRRRLLLALVVCTVADAEIKGINYGGRFIPEHWLGLPHMRELYAGATPGGDCSPKPCKLSLCDVTSAAPTDGDAGQRMIQYLNRSIQLEHFETMKRMGFNYVRLPLGYWNLVRPTEAPDAPNSTASRWRALELMATPNEYAPYIARVLRFANSTGLQVRLSLEQLELHPHPHPWPRPHPHPRPRLHLHPGVARPARGAWWADREPRHRLRHGVRGRWLWQSEPLLHSPPKRGDGRDGGHAIGAAVCGGGAHLLRHRAPQRAHSIHRGRGRVGPRRAPPVL